MAAQAQPPAPCVLVIFGAAGDLTKRLLMPALYNLRRAKLLPEEFALVGVARSDSNDESFRRDLGAAPARVRQRRGRGRRLALARRAHALPPAASSTIRRPTRS